MMPEKRIVVWVQRFKDRPHLVLQWTDPDTGRRKSQSAKTADEKEAEDARTDLEADLNAGRYRGSSNMSWEKFRELYEREHLAGLRRASQEAHGFTLDLFEELVNPRALRSITARTISAFVAALRARKTRFKQGMLPSSVWSHTVRMRTALRWAAGQKLIAECPSFPVVKVPKKKPMPVPPESFDKLLGKAPDANMRAFLLAGWLAGLRLNEALALQWEEGGDAPWTDFNRDRIWLPAEFAKSGVDQWVPLDPKLRQVLEALPRHGVKVFHFVGRDRRPVIDKAVCQRIQKMAHQAGVKLTMHTLRKGFGCRYAGKVPAQVLQRLMRHADIKMTMAYYANVDAAVEEAVLGAKRNALRNGDSSHAVVGQGLDAANTGGTAGNGAAAS